MRLLRPFRYVETTTVAEATAELARLGEEARVYAGGAELLLLMREGILRPAYLIDVKPVPDLGGVSFDGTRLRIGAVETHRRIAAHPLVREHLPLLAEATRHVGNPRVRAQGTIGGNLCFADPHSDPAPALLVHDATVVTAGRHGRRELPLESFVKGTFEVDLAPDELLVEVRAVPLASSWRWAYLRFEQFYRPTVNAAVAARLTDGRLAELRIALGCLGPVAVRLRALEAELVGSTPRDAEAVVAGSARRLAELLQPVDDQLGSAEFKLHLAIVHIGRGLRRIAHGSPEAARVG